ncbi:hypothetical protein ADK34_30210 [Streptomyces viridochromogenes]|uniref:RsbT co-antagonist protein RsbRD N-terminal domain-containing protein n=1 Tax=Streptomyces viridochromogenes TaxID=1938 RepID=A0A0L8JJH4_STRVR|nr:hypothetical protein ADK34_30210 [Streptomyces viridochromogenes]
MEPTPASLREGRELTGEEALRFEEFGALRVEQGIALEPFLEAFRLTARRAFDALYVLARSHADQALALEAAGEFWARCDQVSIAVVRGHRRREAERVRVDQQQRTLLRQLLLGELSVDWLPMAADILGLGSRAEYRVCYAVPGRGRDALDRAGPAGAAAGALGRAGCRSCGGPDGDVSVPRGGRAGGCRPRPAAGTAERVTGRGAAGRRGGCSVRPAPCGGCRGAAAAHRGTTDCCRTPTGAAVSAT